MCTHALQLGGYCDRCGALFNNQTFNDVQYGTKLAFEVRCVAVVPLDSVAVSLWWRVGRSAETVSAAGEWWRTGGAVWCLLWPAACISSLGLHTLLIALDIFRPYDACV
jgi:hypothetical protein